MASRMNSGDSNNLNCIRIDPRTGEKFSFNLDIVAATAWQHPQQCTFIHARSFIHFIQWRHSCYCTVHYVTVDQWNRSLLKLHTKSAARCLIAWPHRVGPQRLSGSLYWFIGDIIHSRSIAWLLLNENIFALTNIKHAEKRGDYSTFAIFDVRRPIS